MAKIIVNERKTKKFTGGTVEMVEDGTTGADGWAAFTIRADGSMWVATDGGDCGDGSMWVANTVGGLELTKEEAIEALEAALALVRRGR